MIFLSWFYSELPVLLWFWLGCMSSICNFRAVWTLEHRVQTVLRAPAPPCLDSLFSPTWEKCQQPENIPFSSLAFCSCFYARVAQMVKCLSSMWETQVQSLGGEDLLEKAMATHSSSLAWKTPWIEEPGRLQSMGLQRVGHDWATSFSFSLSCQGSMAKLCYLILISNPLSAILKSLGFWN